MEPQPMLSCSVAASGGHLFIRPGCLRSLQALSQDSQSTSAATMISRTASVITNTNAQVLNSSTVALLAVAKVPRLPRAAEATKLS